MKRRDFIRTLSMALAATATGRMSAQVLNLKNASEAGVPIATLNNGVMMPRLGIGTFLQPNNDVCRASVLAALQNGFRHIDTAHAYNDEEGCGLAVKDSGLKREDVWVTSKLWVNDYGTDITPRAIDEMLGRLQVDYIDLLYVHQPVGRVVEAYRAMEDAYKAGKIRAIGISNFDYPDERCEAIFNEIMTTSEIKPQVLQVECHPYAQRLDVVEKKIKPYNLQLECWYPLGGQWSNGALLKDETLIRIGQAHGKSAAQVILRWHMQEGHSAIPGSKNPDHIKENISIFDFELSDQEMATIRGLNKEERFYNATYEQTMGFANGGPRR